MDRRHIVERAREICSTRGLRLTDHRAVILEEVAEHGPIGAYGLRERLTERLRRRVDPPTVYRALNFLLAAELICRLERRAAYVLRGAPGRSSPGVMLLCDHCKSAVEVESPDLLELIAKDAEARGFQVTDQVIECSGTCERCAANTEPSA